MSLYIDGFHKRTYNKKNKENPDHDDPITQRPQPARNFLQESPDRKIPNI